MSLLHEVAAKKSTFVETKRSEWLAGRIADVLATERDSIQLSFEIGESPSGKFAPKWLSQVALSVDALLETQHTPSDLVFDMEASFMASSSMRGGYGCPKTRMWNRSVTLVMSQPTVEAQVLEFMPHPATVTAAPEMMIAA